MSRKLKRIVIKEELVELVGTIEGAIILQQFLYWSERIKDFDKFIFEEQERCLTSGQEFQLNFTNGWIYKSAKELKEEIMLKKTDATVNNYIESLIIKNWLSKRRNPLHKWDRTYQYRVNLIQIIEDLFELGFFLEGYKYDTSAFLKIKNRIKEIENRDLEFENRNSENYKAIPEITTEITTEIKNNKEKPEKTKRLYGDEFVMLTIEQYDKLNEKLGHELAKRYIDDLDIYLGAKGKKQYTSHYHAILQWHRRNEENGTVPRTKKDIPVKTFTHEHPMSDLDEAIKRKTLQSYGDTQ